VVTAVDFQGSGAGIHWIGQSFGRTTQRSPSRQVRDGMAVHRYIKAKIGTSLTNQYASAEQTPVILRIPSPLLPVHETRAHVAI